MRFNAAIFSQLLSTKLNKNRFFDHFNDHFGIKIRALATHRLPGP